MCLHEKEASREQPAVESEWVSQGGPGSPAQLLPLRGGTTKEGRRTKEEEADQSLAAEEAAALTSIQTHQYQEVHKTHKCTSQTRGNSSGSETAQMCADSLPLVERRQITLGSLAGTSVSRLIILPAPSLFMGKSWKPRKQKLEFFTSSARRCS